MRCLLCVYAQPTAVVVTVQVVKVPAYVRRYVHVTADGLDQAVKHVCTPFCFYFQYDQLYNTCLCIPWSCERAPMGGAKH